ncbi:MAG: hypothetical protein FWD68_18920 [Alphaproteobacteria bacterium]|nr:hypothetical protein [Alphaproteobacteria bacterium]
MIEEGLTLQRLSVCVLCLAMALLVFGTASATELSSEFQAFIAAFPPGKDVRPYDKELSPELREHAHPTLIAFWREVGIGSFGNGFLVLLDPEEYQSALARWLPLKQPDPSRIPFARTAFGDLIYFRDLRQRARTQGLPGDWESASDVAFLSIHYRSNAVITHSMKGFFAQDLNTFLKARKQSLYELFRTMNPQPLARNQCFYFVPALVLGGTAGKDSISSGNCLVHHEILLGFH